MRGPQELPGWRLPRPGKALTSAMVVVFSSWLAFALAVNWGGADARVFELFCGNTRAILGGEVWRLGTAPLMHHPSQYAHVLFSLVGLYFLSPALEERWGSARFGRFLLASAWLAYTLQMLVEIVLPDDLSRRLVGEYWFGLGPVIEAIAIAWALSFRGRTVYLMMALPVSSGMLVLFVVGVSVLALVSGQLGPSGLVAPFGGMFAGWLFAGGSPPPWRRAWLRLRLRRQEQELARLAEVRQRRIRQSGLRVVEGGSRTPDDDSEPPSSRPGPRGKWLN
jgi:membrane associated rhomboid family serine protease